MQTYLTHTRMYAVTYACSHPLSAQGPFDLSHHLHYPASQTHPHTTRYQPKDPLTYLIAKLEEAPAAAADPKVYPHTLTH